MNKFIAYILVILASLFLSYLVFMGCIEGSIREIDDYMYKSGTMMEYQYENYTFRSKSFETYLFKDGEPLADLDDRNGVTVKGFHYIEVLMVTRAVAKQITKEKFGFY